MTYDWQGTIPAAPGSPAYLDEVERRFLHEAWFAQEPGATPFSGLIDLEAIEGMDVLEIGCGTGVHTRLLAAAGARVSAVDLTSTAVEYTRTRLAMHGLDGLVEGGLSSRMRDYHIVRSEDHAAHAAEEVRRRERGRG